MSRYYSQVPLNLWNKPAFRAMTDDCKLATLFFWCGPHSTSAGVSVVKDLYAVADLGWTMEKWEQVRGIVEQAGFIRRNAESQEVLVVGYLAANKPSGSSHRRAVVSQIARTTCPELKAMAEAELAGIVAAKEPPSLTVVSDMSPQMAALAKQKGWAT